MKKVAGERRKREIEGNNASVRMRKGTKHREERG
jgi:hypothetical protein